jgi:hypothetical protein
MLGRRVLRLRVLESLERSAKQFKTDEDLYPLRVPRTPLALADVVHRALAEEGGHFDPLLLRSRTLLRLEWDDRSSWETWVTVLPSGLKLFCDAGEEEPHVLASGGRHANDETDRQFLQLLAESAGERFGIEMSGGAPSRVWCSVNDRTFLVDVFTELFEVTGAEESVREQLATTGRLKDSGEADFRAEVEVWLSRALRRDQPGSPARHEPRITDHGSSQ